MAEAVVQPAPWHRAELALILRFLIAGLVNAAFGYGVFALCLWATAHTALALLLSNIAGVAFNFQTARHFVFGTPGNTLRFVLLYGFILALNWLVLTQAARLGLSRYAVQAAMAPVIAGLAFAGQRFLVFDPPRSAPPESTP